MRDLFAAFAWSVALYPIVAGLGVVGSALTVRLLTPQGFAVLIWTSAAIQIVLTATDLGTSLMLQRGDTFGRVVTRLVLVRLTLTLVAGTAVALASPYSHELSTLVLIAAAALCQSILGVVQSRLAAELDAVALRVIGVVGSIALPAVIVVMTWTALTNVLLALFIASFAEATFGAALLSRRVSAHTLTPASDRTHIGGLMVFYYVDKLGKTVASGTGGVFVAGLSRLSSAVAVFGLAADFTARIEALAFGALGSLLLPVTGRVLREQGETAAGVVFRESSRYLLLTFGSVMLFAALVAPSVLPLLYGGRYVDAIVPAQVLLLAQGIAGSLGPPAWNYAVTTGWFGPALLVRVGGSLGMMLSAPGLGTSALPLTIAVASALLIPALLLHAATQLRLRPDRHGRTLLRVLIAQSGAGMVSVSLNLFGGPSTLVLSPAAFAVVLVVLLRLTRAFHESDRELLQKLPSPFATLSQRILLGPT